MKYAKPEKELQNMFNLEWKRAKKILSPLLNNIKKPFLYEIQGRGRQLGIHFGKNGTYAIKLNKQWIKNSHAIGIRVYKYLKDIQEEYLRSEEEITRTIRHEICHVLEQNHRSRFHSLLKLLN